VENIKAKLDYPLMKQTVDISLEEDDEEKIRKILDDIKEIVQAENMPDQLDSNICKKCAYFDLCMI